MDVLGTQFFKINSINKLVLYFIFVTFVALSAFRIFLLIHYSERIVSTGDALYMLIQGARVDLVLMGYVYLIPFLVSVFLADNKLSGYIAFVIKLWLVMAFTTLIFMEVITPEFIAEYDVRPNRLFLDYLKYPGEVSSMLWAGYKGAILLGLAGLYISLKVAFNWVKNVPSHASYSSIFVRVPVFFLAIVIGFLSIRSSLQHRPFNPSMVYFSNDNLVNTLILNSSYSLLYSAYNSREDRDTSQLYGAMPENEIIDYVRSNMNVNSDDFISSKYPTLAKHRASYRGKPKNIVILLQESLGSRYVGSLGGEDLTPNLDRLMQEGWAFTQLHATGTRSVRGIEAVITGFNPTPARSVVKLEKSQTGFFTIASLLKSRGYQTQFIYGGESHFDNMKSFFLGNGFSNIHDLPVFDHPHFVGSWGASDEDLYNEAHKELSRMYKTGKPFFSLVFTTTNHTPFEYPDTCMKLNDSNSSEDTRKGTRENAIRYSDCALGKFFEKAKKADYWQNTLFLVVADHDSRAFGSSLIPIEHFEIPALILGKDIVARRDERLSSQIDLPPTLLSLAGIDASYPMTGFDLTHDIPESKQRALMQYGENFAWMDRELITVFQPGKIVKVFKHNGHQLQTELSLTDTLKKMKVKPAKAQALFGGLAYQKGLYDFIDLKGGEVIQH